MPTERRAGPVEGGLRSGTVGGGAALLATGDAQTALLIAGVSAVMAALGNWGRKNQGMDGFRGFFADVFGALGG